MTTLKPGQTLCRQCTAYDGHRFTHTYSTSIKSTYFCNACEIFDRRMNFGEFPCQNIGCGDPKKIELIWKCRKVGNRSTGKEREEARTSDRELRARYSWKLRKASRLNPYGLCCFGRALSFHCTRQGKAWPAPAELRDHNVRAKYVNIEQQLSHRKPCQKNKNKHQKDTLHRSWQHDLDAINRRGCAIEYDLDEAKNDRRLRLAEEEEEGRLSGLAYDILAERFGKWCFIGHMMVESAVRTHNSEYEEDIRNRYEDHLIGIEADQCSRHQEEEADLDRIITREMAETPQPSQDDDLAFCGPPQVTRDGKTVTVLQRDPKAQQRFGALLKAKHQQEAPYRYWERTSKRQPAKPSKHFDEGEGD